MSYISAKEWELLSFFEVEPHRLDLSVPWIYDDSIYFIEAENLSLSVAIQPAYKDIRIILKHHQQRLYEFQAMGVEDIRVFKEKGEEILEIIVSKHQHLRIKIRPLIEILEFG